ncbi:SusC/RagA family TonB-linked outer membrane protein [Pedobacter sandarakinus]|uniref:SusC/RagA family TonB-linked outer membrane protein n=1 Tax=Pedobacter sandarakinus TaxID=353156 RepID=UPI00224617F9|nr:SusC/RagA family TonB-linked outer membrane protein [Pedobacter sandarakinus]MCX2573676.1 SusC/RagA family TonB-linked outer membrane protein [Pedobacter sandarakinus]
MKKLLQSLFILLFVAFNAVAQDRTVTGTVTSQEDGLPVPGATVRVKDNPGIGTLTTANGKYSIKVPVNANTLVVSFLGYSSKEVTIPASNSINIVLNSDAQALNEVVVTAGGVSIQRRQQGNQSTTLKSQELTQGKAFNVASALTGKVAGLQVNAVSSGVNPDVRLVLRGNRSLLGNNQALVVVDNVIVPSSVLGNLNPEDIESIDVLNGAGAAALYGSDASNGAVIVTTKKGKTGVTTIKVGQTTSFETIAYLPKLQKEYGSGTTPDDVPTYTPFENQQYGPAFDGSMRVIGKPLVDGSIQTVPYSWNEKEGKNNFWDTGINNQTDFSLSAGDEKSKYFLSSQYFDQTSTVPGDKYNRFSLRINGSRDLSDKFNFDFNANYVQNRYDQGDSGNAFTNVLMSPGQIPLTRYSDWKNDPYASPNGFYNEYFDNPYFTLGNARTLTRNDYLTGNVQLKYNPIKELSVLFRVSIATRNISTKSYSDKFTFSDYRKSISGTAIATDRVGSINDGASYTTQLNPEFQAQYIKQINKDFSINAILGGSLRDNIGKNVGANSSVFVTPGLYNVSNTTGNVFGFENNNRVRQLGVYADARLGFRNYLYLHVTGRNDWRSVLARENNSLFYPAADISFIASDAIPFLKESKVVTSLKIRGGISRVGQVNLNAYALAPTFGQQFGYPYAGVPGFGVGNTVVSSNIKPELTTSIEGGFDLEMYKSRVSLSLTLYKSNTVDQTLPVQIAQTTGFTSFLTNTGEVENRGIETSLRLVPVQTNDWTVTVGGNFTLNANKVLSISTGSDNLSLATFGRSNLVAEVGSPFPLLKGSTYNKDPQGRIIVDRITGFPSATNGISTLGYTEPKYRLGLDASVSYKGFRFATVFEYRAGNVIYSGVSTAFDFSGAGIRTTYFNRERFVVPNSSYLDPTTNTYVANTNITTRTGGADFWTNGPTNTDVNSNYTYSAAFWKLREASLSYDLPASVIKNVRFIKGATVSVQGRNLFLWAPKTNVYTDPEYSAFNSSSNAIGFTSISQTPPGRFYGLSLTVTL